MGLEESRCQLTSSQYPFTTGSQLSAVFPVQQVNQVSPKKEKRFKAVSSKYARSGLVPYDAPASRITFHCCDFHQSIAQLSTNNQHRISTVLYPL